jgi:hypothetical protein
VDVVVVADTFNGTVMLHRKLPGVVLLGASVDHPEGAVYAPVDQV